MPRLSSLASESSRNSVAHKFPLFKSFGSTRRIEGSRSGTRSWRPSAFRPWVLLVAILICWTLIVILQLLLIRSQKNDGLIFADDISDLPLSRSFVYLYLPTIIAILFSIFWSWIDLQIKRLEPYYQLSKPGGANGKDSLLLKYPFDFVPFVPFSAIRHRHWAVFWGSTAIVVVTWGLVPLQAGLFVSSTVTKMTNATFTLSTGFIPADQQGELLTNRYAHSVHGIIWLNETLPPYMSLDYVIAPFQVRDADEPKKLETWTAQTQLYSVDISCEVPKLDIEHGNFTTSFGCYMGLGGNGSAYDQLGETIIGENKWMGNQSVYDYKEFGANYVGYPATDYASYYLEGQCPEEANHTFMIAFARSRRTLEDPPQKATRLFCQPFYYVQDVNATIDRPTAKPLKVDTNGPKRQLPTYMWNSTLFEYSMNGGLQNLQRRGDMPTQAWPNQLESLSKMQISLANTAERIPNMAGFAIGASNHDLSELIDPEVLRISFERAYRLVLGRSLTEILDQTFSSTKDTPGHISIITGAITMVPLFVYIVQGLLGFISVCAIILLYISKTRRWAIHSDPATISSVMSLVADNAVLLQNFSHLDCSTVDLFEDYLKQKNFNLVYDKQRNTITNAEDFGPVNDNTMHTVQPRTTESQILKPVRPREFQSLTAIPFVSLQIALAVALGILWLKAKANGISRPSEKAIIRQILENYIPTAIATFIEPVWILINRLLCMLQPLEELRTGNASAKASIDADYSSVPPQLVIFRAFRSGHYKLATVSLMALLANILAISFSGLFNERATSIQIPTQFNPLFEAKFVSINGSSGPSQRPAAEPSGAYSGGLGIDQFLVAESNYTANTTLPPWTDNDFMYVPFTNQPTSNGTFGLQARTSLFGASLDCNIIGANEYTSEMTVDRSLGLPEFFATFHFNISNAAGNSVTCSKVNQTVVTGPPTDLRDFSNHCHTGAVAMELVLVPQASENSTVEDKALCAETAVLGWFRDPGNMCVRNETTQFNDTNALFIVCRPKLTLGEADVLVNNEGRIQNASIAWTSSDPTRLNEHFENHPRNLLQQGNQYIFQYPGAMWHNDSFASEFMNYFMIKEGNSSRLLDPRLPLPSLDDIRQRLYPVYSKVFAIWISINMKKLLVPIHLNSTQTIEGERTEQQIRIFISKPLFIVAEVILSTYAVVAFIIYIYRPGRYLPYLPTSIATIIGLFAASSAVRDMEGTSLLCRKERRKKLAELDHRYGYGNFVGTDGRPHVGIEREPLVDVAPIPGVIERVQTGFSKKSRFF